MNIKITYNWLLEYLETDADPYEIQKYLSLCGPGVERIEKIDDDYVFDIEVTSNRVDMASVFGIAQEAQAILPIFGKKARIKHNPLETYGFDSVAEGNSLPLTVKIVDPSLCSRFTAIVLSNVKITHPPAVISKRLQMCDIKSINNVVDISNYLMLALGQPTHMFDYDGIGKATMILRESKKGEKIQTLDEKEFSLPGGDIVVEDGNGKIVDLCGIMGGLNSSIKSTTKNIVFFVQTYNKQKIRRTSMTTGQRTVAATYFEKGLDEERVEPTVGYGVELLEKYTGGKVASKIYDIYPNPYKKDIIIISQNDIKRVMGIDIESDKIVSILNNLGFETVKKQNDTFQVMVPSWRKNDIEIKEDIVEEVARVYGYHNLPNNVQSAVMVPQPKEVRMLFSIQSRIKYFLKHLGLHEQMNYSMVSEELLKSLDLNPDDHLELLNTISEEIRYFRKSLLPSLIKNMKDNEGKKDILKFFEIAKVYIPKKGELPDEQYKLSIATNTNFANLKGIVEAVFHELNIEKYSFKNADQTLFSSEQATVTINEKPVGTIGQLKPKYQDTNDLSKAVYLLELDLNTLIEEYRLIGSYRATNPYATVKLDVTVKKTEMSFAELQQKASDATAYLEKVELIDTYQDNITLRFYFSRKDRNMTENEAKVELDKIKSSI